MRVAVDNLLRAEGSFAPGERNVPWSGLALLVALGGFAYGTAMGSFGLHAAQAFYSGTKVPLLLLVSTVICLPNFYVVNVVVVTNGVLFAVATYAGQLTLNKHYRVLVAADPRHRVGRITWVTLYVFVSIQAAWILRPFIGAPDLPSRFLREDPRSNAYVKVFEHVWKLLASAFGNGGPRARPTSTEIAG